MYGENFSVAFSTLSVLARLGMIAAAILGLAATSAIADPIPYRLLTTIVFPSDGANVQPGKAFTSFDISFFDPVTRNDYVADRSNASVDIFSGASLSPSGLGWPVSGDMDHWYRGMAVKPHDGACVTNPGTTIVRSSTEEKK